jgi:hypothetical protein
MKKKWDKKGIVPGERASEVAAMVVRGDQQRMAIGEVDS